uniref:GIY-YIG endonuclease n=1 Tax=Juglanconis juglandina TaxID=1940567 RepID=A0A291LJ23_9PEZI|nr:GIY-YIG endonuclease [Juglanconis juglandina]
MFNIKCSYSGQLNRLFRFESNLTKPKIKRIESRPNSLALEHINSCNSTTSEVINSVLLNQKVSISQKELDELLSLPSVNFYLPITNQTYPGLLGLIGKPGSRRSNSGVYIFSHKYSDKKYVGSSNDLARRFKQYFEKKILFNNKDTGVLLPLIEKEELISFTLQVTVIPSSYSKFSHCFLEQYYLLNKEFNLNTHKIVNFRVNQGFKIYLYDKDCKILYYSSNSLNAFCADLGIHHSSYKKHIANNSSYLDYFTISNNLVEKAIPAGLTELELRELIDEGRKLSLNELHLSYGKPIEVLDSDTNTTKIYESAYKVATRLGFSRSSLRNYIANGKAYKNRYIFKYANKTEN